MNGGNWATIIVGLITLAGAVFSGISANRASKYNTRTQAETEAYERARKMDTETIERQEKALEKLRKEVEELKEDNEMLHGENKELRQRIYRLENPGGTP